MKMRRATPRHRDDKSANDVPQWRRPIHRTCVGFAWRFHSQHATPAITSSPAALRTAPAGRVARQALDQVDPVGRQQHQPVAQVVLAAAEGVTPHDAAQALRRQRRAEQRRDTGAVGGVQDLDADRLLGRWCGLHLQPRWLVLPSTAIHARPAVTTAGRPSSCVPLADVGPTLIPPWMAPTAVASGLVSWQLPNSSRLQK
jgi:hypothetical protein